MRKQLTNTQLYCLMGMQKRGPISPRYIALARWPGSKQIDKKTLTIRRALDGLVKAGFAVTMGPTHYGCTVAGRYASVSQVDRPVLMRLA